MNSAPALDHRATRFVAIRSWLQPGSVTFYALAIAIVTRIALAGAMWLSLRAIPRLPPYPGQFSDTFFPTHPFLDGWARWDAAHHILLAEHGYGPGNPSPHGGLGFFPLFAILIRGLVELVGAAATPANLATAALVIANLCFLAIVPLLANLTARAFGPEAGRNAAGLLCVAPFSFFFNAAYSESLFVLLVVASLTCADRGRWWVAASFAGLAAGTRLVGLGLVPALMLLAWRRRASLREIAGIAVISPSGALAWAAYCWWKFDNPLAYFDAQAEWGGWDEHVRFYVELFFTRPGDALRGDPRHMIILINVALALMFTAFIPSLWRRLNPGVALFSTLMIVAHFTFTWVSLGRYLLPAFGVFMLGGWYLTRLGGAGWVRDCLILGSSILLTCLALLYGHGFWVV
jgi:hypothetical protein